jgi:rhodanese-related sulfurtransferase
MPADYDARATQYGLATKEQLQATLEAATSASDKSVTVMDVRTPTEIDEAGRWDLSMYPNVKTVTVYGVTPTDASPVVEYFKDQDTTSSSSSSSSGEKFILYCRSGRRADTAINAMVSQCGMDKDQCLNAGGCDDVVGMGFPIIKK